MKLDEKPAKATGRLRVEVRNLETGAVDVQEFDNLVVDSGLNLLRDILGSVPGANALSHFAYGTDATAAAASQVALVAEVFRSAITATITSVSKTLQLTHYLSSTQANGNTLREVGIFNGASGGCMYSRAVITTPIVKTSTITVTTTWTLTWSAS